MKKKLLILASIISVIIFVITIIMTYALFESNVSAEISVNNATWKILINNTDITKESTKEFTIDQINVTGDTHTEGGKIAPGLSGNFNILIDPTDTDVSIKYEVTFDLSNLENTKIQIDSIEETILGKELLKTGDNTYTGVITLDEIRQGIKNEITVNLSWKEDETTNAEDTLIGSSENSRIEIPVSIKVSQYLGEEIESI